MRWCDVLAVATLAARLLGTAPTVEAAEQVTIATVGPGNLAFLHYDLAEKLGYFKDEGLEATLQYTKSGSQATLAVLTGAAEFGGASFDNAVRAAAQGKPLTMIAAFVDVPAFQLLVRPALRDAVRSLSDLKGRPIGVTGLGSATHMMLTYLLRRAGLEPGEINAVPVGFEGLAAAMENERVDAVLTGGAPAVKLVEAGRGFALADLTSRTRAEAFFGGPYVDAGVLTRPQVVAERPELCRKVVRAVVRAGRWMADHSATEIAALLPEGLLAERQVYVKALETMRDAYAKDGRVDPRGVETVVAIHRAFGLAPDAQPIDPRRLFDNTFVDRVPAGGS